MEKNKKRAASYKAKEIYLLSGILFCGLCHKSMVGESKKGRNGTYHYYSCNEFRRKRNCENTWLVRKEKIESEGIEHINNLLFYEKNIDTICRRIYETAHAQNDNTEKINEIKSEISKIDTKIKNLSRAIANGTDVPEMHEMINDFSSQKNALKIQQYELETVPQANEKTFKEIKELFILNTDLKKLPPESQKLVIQKLISRIYLYPPKGDGDKYRAKIIIAPYNKDSLTDLFDYVGDNLDSMVEVTGFEPTASTSRT